MPTVRRQICTLLQAALLVGVVGVVGWQALGCQGEEPAYYIGVALPLSGAEQAPAEELLHGVELFVDEINADGGVDGRPLRIVTVDDDNTPEGAAKAARELAGDDRVLGVVGHFYSSTALGATEVYDEAGLVNLVPVANDPRVTRDSSWVFGMLPPTDAEGRFMAAYLSEVLDVSRVVVISETAAYGDGLSSSFIGAAEQRGIEIVAVDRFNPAEDLPDTIGASTRAAFAEPTPPPAEDKPGDEPADEAANPGDEPHGAEADPHGASPRPESPSDDEASAPAQDAVVVFSQVSAGKEILADLRGAGVDAPVVVPSAFVEDPTLPEFYKAFDGPLYATSPFLYETGNQQATRFRARYIQRYGDSPGAGAPMTYDATRLLAEAIEQAGPDRQAIRDHLANLRDERTLHSVTGALSFDDHGAVDRGLYVTRVEDDYFKVAFSQLVPLDEGGYRQVDVVYVGIDQFRVENIDPANFSFAMELFMWMKWRSESLDTEDITIINGVYGIDDERYVLQEDLTGDVNYRAYRIKSDYLTPFDLRHFPYDQQNLRLQVGHRTKDSTELMLVPDVGHYLEEPVDLYDPEWNYIDQQVYSELYRYPSKLGDPSIAREHGSPYFSSLNVNTIVARNAFPHLLNAVLPLVLILALTTVVLWLSRLKVSERLGIGMTSLLATLVFHMTQSATLPNVGYLTIIDVYFVLAYLAIFALFLVLFGTYLLTQNDRPRAAAIINRVGPAVVMVVAIFAYAWITLGVTG